MAKPINAVIFDLDGTLLDTATDLGCALNRILQVRDLAPLPQEKIRPVVGQGYKGLFKIGLNIDENNPEYEALCEEFRMHYNDFACKTTQFFPGVEKVLQHLEEKKIPWGIVTNKPGRFTAQLAQALGLDKRAVCIISGDTLANAKPHPEPVLHACKLLGQEPASCLFVGDAEIDILAAKAAGVPVLAALYGYISVEENPRGWHADGYIYHPEEIIDWLVSTDQSIVINT